MLKKYIETISAGILSRYLKEREVVNMPIGYNPLPKIRQGLYQWIYLPFNDVRVWCELRSLNANQIETCGDFSLLREVVKNPQKATKADIIRVRNSQEKLAMAVLNRPTYKEIEKLIFEQDNVIEEKRAELEALKQDFENNRKNLTAIQINNLKTKMDELEFFLGYILPEDAFGFLTKWALGVDISEIKSLSRQRLLEAAVLAKNSNKAPSSYLSGIFTDRDKSEIDKAAWIIYQEWIEENRKTKRGNS